MKRYAQVLGVLLVVGTAAPVIAASPAAPARPKLQAPSGAQVMMEAHLSEQDLLPIIRDFISTAAEVASQAVPAEIAGQINLPTPDDIRSLLGSLRAVDVLMLKTKGKPADLVKFYEPDLQRRGLYPLFRMQESPDSELVMLLTAPGLRESFFLMADPSDEGVEAVVASIDGMVDFSKVLAWVRANAGQLAMVARQFGPMLGGGGGGAPVPEGPVIGFTYEETDDGQLRVVTVMEDSLAAKAGMQAGDVVVAVDGTPVADINQAADLISQGKKAGKVEITCRRGGQEHKFSFTFDTGN